MSSIPEDKARILVVDDDPYIRALMRYCLKSRYEVHLVSRFEDALHEAARKRFDIFLLDINLGETRTGVDLLKALHKMPTCSTIPAIACTADMVLSARDYFVQFGFVRQVSKPFSREELVETIDAVLSSTTRNEQAPQPDLPLRLDRSRTVPSTIIA